MVRPTLKKQIPNLQETIKDTAWKQITEFGAPALSLRAIARELKITAPAVSSRSLRLLSTTIFPVATIWSLH